MRRSILAAGAAPLALAAAMLLAAVLLASCGPSRRVRNIVRTDLFSLSYGVAENQAALASGGAERFDVVMREGIFHILNGTGRKVMKLSSYGDLLALLYDPAVSPEPRLDKTDAQRAEGAQAAQGRYAAPVSFLAPSRIAVDSAQTIYVADRMAPSARVFDQQTGSWCDGSVRRFGTQGAELAPLGQEGPGGTPFPTILSVDAMENETLSILSASESFVLVYHFGKAGNLLSVLRLARESLPVPESLGGTSAAKPGKRIHANIDGIQATSQGADFEVALKLDYYREGLSAGGEVSTGIEYVGSWIYRLDGQSGAEKGRIALAPGGGDADIPQLIGISGGVYYFLYGGEDRGAESLMLQLTDEMGKAQARYRMELPDGTREVMALKVSAKGQVYALLGAGDAIKAVWWDYH